MLKQDQTPILNVVPFVGEIDRERKRHLSIATIPDLEFSSDRYVVRFARTFDEIDQALQLRFEVFNVELNEGLAASFITGRDEDRFDVVCHHLIVLEKETGAIIGTYRLLTHQMASALGAFYSSAEFLIENLPPQVLHQSLEIGRACIAREHRNTKVLFLLWKGLANYAAALGKRYLFGCCSLTSQDPRDGWAAMEYIREFGFLHRDFFIGARDEFVCRGDLAGQPADLGGAAYQLPRLFSTYMRFGARVCSEPAIDRGFKTIDFFVMLDLEKISVKTREMFLG